MSRFISYLGGITGTLLSHEGFIQDDLVKLSCGIGIVIIQGLINIFTD